MPGVQGSLQVLMDFGISSGECGVMGRETTGCCAGVGGMPAAPMPCSPSAPFVLFLP